MLGLRHQQSHPRAVSTLGTATLRPLELLHTDIAGSITRASAGGAKLFATVLGDYRNFKAVKPSAKKSDTLAFFKEDVTNCKADTGHRCHSARPGKGVHGIQAAELLQEPWYRVPTDDRLLFSGSDAVGDSTRHAKQPRTPRHVVGRSTGCP